MRKIILLLLIAVCGMLRAQQQIGVEDFVGFQQKKATIIDVRSPQVYMYDHVVGAQCFPANSPDLQKRMKSLPKKKPVVLYGDTAAIVEKTASLFAEKGFDVYVLQGGVEAYLAAGNELYQFRDTAEIYGYMNGYGSNPNATGRATLHLGEKYVLLNIGSHNTFFNLKPEDLTFAREKDGETNLIFRNPEEHYKYIRIELSERHFHLITTSKQTGETVDYCFSVDRE